jgi:UDP-N-acetyl-D-glucosamine/UDP-N-acetyl-D-galactosamine dehydrogenase
MSEQLRIAVIGLGYVGYPLACSLAKQFEVIGYDISPSRVHELSVGKDIKSTLTDAEMSRVTKFKCTTSESDLCGINVFIVTVPTPIDDAKQPDLNPIYSACKTVGKVLERGACVVFESTVYPGVTEEVCAPYLEEVSGLKWQLDFNIGYSPERINPGDNSRSLTDIVKVISADNDQTLKLLRHVYGSIITAGIYEAPSIKVAEAAKVIENTQRDLNIALINELAIVCNLLKISTTDVLAAAGTKWNFSKYTPGLVGGHCIGVDPYYLTFKAQQLGYIPQLILAGRKVNEDMVNYIASEMLKRLASIRKQNAPWKVMVLGLTFKENCPDVRNSKIIDLVNLLRQFGAEVSCHDPLLSGIREPAPELLHPPFNDSTVFDAIILGSPHLWYMESGFLSQLLTHNLKKPGLFVDIKNAYKGLLPTGVSGWSL